MEGYINGIDWVNIEPMKYWSFTASTSIEKRKEVVNQAIFGKEYIGALKVDGYYQRIIKDEDGNCFMIARSRNVKGEVVNKIEWVPQLIEWMKYIPNGTCLLSECFLPNMEGSKNITSILGCLKEKALKRQEKTPLHFYVFDIMAWNGENFNKTKFIDRTVHLRKFKDFFGYIEESKYIHFADYLEGEDLWNGLQSYLSEGREGVVIMRKDAIVYEKRTPARVSIKIKKELHETIDAVILSANAPTREYTGKEIITWKLWEDLKTGEKLKGDYYKEYSSGMDIEPVTKNYWHGWAGSLNIGLYDKDKNKLVMIGSISGLTEEILSNWQDYKGKIVEVTGMQLMRDDEGKFTGIRHPKVVRFRDDKTIKECTMDQVR